MSVHRFEFKRGALKLHINLSGGYIGASIFLAGGKRRPVMHAAYMATVAVDRCYLQLGGDNRDGSTDLPCLWMERNAVDLRDAELKKLRAVLEPLGVTVRPHKPSPPLPPPAAPAPAAPTPTSADRTYGGEVEGCGGDAELDRTSC